MIDDSDFIFAQSLREKKCFCWCHTNTLSTILRRFPLLEHLEHTYRLLTSSDVLLLRIRKCPETQSLQSILLDQDFGLRRNEVRMTNVYKLWQGTSMGGIPSNLLDPFVSLPNTESSSLASLLSVKFLGCPIINTKISPREIERMRSHLLSGDNHSAGLMP